ncbi:MAG: 3-ketoacyl-ACP reductase [Phycisphaerae bacterium]|jgi:NAD(P)-dependent dehydrogenase (short-subunit alcohol dehydrogenase family)|nr:MAG: 3-ketoacyl-ACP reductase [Phycisphaerae bacterium]
MFEQMKAKQVAIVTGGSRGIGRAIAVALGREGFDVVVNYARSAQSAEEVKAEIEKSGSRAHIVQADISVRQDRDRLVDETIKTFGQIDLLVNNAGVAPDVRADVLEATEESFDRLININLKGPYFLTQRVARHMAERRQGKIINITSISAYTAHTHRGDYGVSKAGLAMMTQVFAARMAEFGVHVYEIRPGVIQTDMTGPVKEKYDDLIFNKDLTPIKRWGQPDDVARAVLAIAKDYFPFSTGEVFNVDGGFAMRRL